MTKLPIYQINPFTYEVFVSNLPSICPLENWSTNMNV